MYKYRILIFVLLSVISLSWKQADLFKFGNAATPIISDTSVCDKVLDGKYNAGDQITTLSLGGISPGQIRIIIKGKDRDNFPSPPEKLYIGKTVCVKGPVETQDGQLSIVIKDPGQIVIQQ
ncbi:MAG TPA: hypothetical protein VGI38_05960 [Puia sp.]